MPSSVMPRKGQVTIRRPLREDCHRMRPIIRAGELMCPQRGSILDLEGSVEPRRRPENFEAVRPAVLRRRRARAGPDLHPPPANRRGRQKPGEISGTGQKPPSRAFSEVYER